jgi:hypothetical protein
MEERGIRTIVGTLRAVFSVKSPTWLTGAVGAGAGAVTRHPEVAVACATAGMVAGGAIELASYALDARTRQQQEKSSPY